MSFGLQAAAQSWQWGSYAGSRPTVNNSNTVSGLALDVHGNSYMTVDIGPRGIYAGTIKFPDTKGSGLNLNTILLVSYDCQGNYRWSKRLSGQSASTKGLKVSRSGRVYVFGVIATGTLDSGYYDTDTTTPNTYQGMSLVCYDTMGRFQWLQRPDTITGDITHYLPVSMDMDDTGNVYCLVSMPPGNRICGSGLTIPATRPYSGLGAYVLKYNPSGKLLSVTMLRDMSYTNHFLRIAPQMNFTYNPLNQGYYLSGWIDLMPENDSLFLRSRYVNHNMYLASFAADGSLKWYETDTSVVPYHAYIISPVVLDKTGNLYFGGSLPHTDMFGGYRAENPWYPTRHSYMPFLMKADSNGKALWAVSGGRLPSFSGLFVGGYLAINQEYAVVGGMGGLQAYFGDPATDTFTINVDKPGGPGADAWYAVVNLSTTKTEKIGVVKGNGILGVIQQLALHNNDLFIGGNSNSVIDTVDNELVIGPKLSSSGTDAFLAKYSLPCGCLVAPLASFDYNSSGGIFSFTGTKPADSVTWDFGDGERGLGLVLGHTYAVAGRYKVCATVWTSGCGKKTFCKEIEVTASVAGLSSGASLLQLYPNPAGEQLYIGGLSFSPEIRVLNIWSRVVMRLPYDPDPARAIHVQHLPAGTYFLEAFGADGRRYAGRFVKE